MDKPDTTTALILIFIITFALVFFILLNPDTHDIFSRLETHVGVLTVIIIIAIFLTERIIDRYKTTKEEIDRINNTCNAIIKEFEDHKNAFTDKPGAEDFIKIGNIEYVSRILNTNAYESILHSGLYTNFDSNIQNKLSNLYNHIIRKNQLIDYLHIYKDNFLLSDRITIRNNAWKQRQIEYQTEIARLDRAIKYKIDEVEPLIKEKGGN